MDVKIALITLLLPLILNASLLEEYVEYFGHWLTVFSNDFHGPKIADPKHDYDFEVYDFIIVGAGSAGCVLANRLSEIHEWKILLLEAGLPENPIGKIPMASQILQTTQYNWKYQTIPQNNGCLGMIDNICNQVSGKGLGGSNSIGDSIYTTGNRLDYEEWKSAGNSHWGYEDVLPYFKKAEHVRLYHYDEGYHGEDGPNVVELQKNPSKIRKHFLRAVKELNYSILDYNGKSQIGFNDAQVTTLRGKRNSVSTAYLESAYDRPNLVIKTSSFVEKLLIDHNEVYGVKYRRYGRELIARAKKEIVLSAGVYGSPKILQLSGIGPSEYLKSVGIDPLINLPVGNNLRDHIVFLGLQLVFNKWPHEIDYLYSFIDWFLYGEGPLTSCGIDALGYLNSRFTTADPEYSDIEIALSPVLLNQGYRIVKPLTNFRKETYDSFYQNTEGKDSFVILVFLSRPKSSGTVRIKSKNPHDDPLIDPKYLENPDDVEILLSGIRRALEILNTTEFRTLNASLNMRQVEGCDNFGFGTDQYWRCAIRRLHISASHASGTNKMGPENDDTAVVDDELKVYGLSKLRVIDASVIPNSNTAHTNAPTVMLAEKGSDIIKKYHHN